MLFILWIKIVHTSQYFMFQANYPFQFVVESFSILAELLLCSFTDDFVNRLAVLLRSLFIPSTVLLYSQRYSLSW